jgi:hypothetical protein
MPYPPRRSPSRPSAGGEGFLNPLFGVLTNLLRDVAARGEISAEVLLPLVAE